MRWERHCSDINPRSPQIPQAFHPSPQTEPNACSPNLLLRLGPSLGIAVHHQPDSSFWPPVTGQVPRPTGALSQVLPGHPHASIPRTAGA